jgi:YVTN family beta-propeller protein
VIDPAANKLLGSIHLGENVPAALSPLYRGELLVHGLGFSPEHKTLDVVSIGSNSVTLIDTQTNTGKGTIYVGRSPHEAFFRHDGRELWVAGLRQRDRSGTAKGGTPNRDRKRDTPVQFVTTSVDEYLGPDGMFTAPFRLAIISTRRFVPGTDGRGLDARLC